MRITAIHQTTPVDGLFGAARRFSTASDYIDLPENPSLAVDGPLSIAMWVRVHRLGLHQHMVACTEGMDTMDTPHRPVSRSGGGERDHLRQPEGMDEPQTMEPRGAPSAGRLLYRVRIASRPAVASEPPIRGGYRRAADLLPRINIVEGRSARAADAKRGRRAGEARLTMTRPVFSHPATEEQYGYWRHDKSDLSHLLPDASMPALTHTL
jgi:hypothetical protein